MTPRSVRNIKSVDRHATASWTPGAISAGGSASKTFTGGIYTGIVAGDFTQVSIPGAGNGCVLEAATSADTITLTYRNPSAGSLTPASGTYGATARRSA